tara:strand:+ start:2102 stop:3097 length:996 start_codon:yes stop_codon:yes gene_type:complete
VVNKLVVVIFVHLMFINCTRVQDPPKIKVDMSAMHDQGLFKPEQGDKLSIAGSFNDWEPDAQNLMDEDGDWIFETSLSDTDFKETTEFKFVIVSDNQMDLPNSGWEVIPNRQINVETLRNESPILTYNKPWSPLITEDLTFRVNMNNQKVLGFFDPEKGDKVVVAGTFNDWDEQGIRLDRIDFTLTYELTFPVQKRKHENTRYKYRISSLEMDEVINDGWELIDERIYTTSTGLEYFNNQKRVLNLTFSEEWIQEQTKLNKDDVFYAKLEWNNETQNYRFTKNEISNTYEVAVQIPEVITDVDVVIVKNLEEEIFRKENIIVPLNGKEIKF